ncbi:hypothetical protein FACS1894187_24990 [Synergistales bacterium]|nr:hypothetical protein FACS1894187_24990 [Synergistales bacterium]
MGLFSYPTSQTMSLRMPWFRELCAENLVPRNKNVILLKALPSETVLRAFDAFAEEFLPKAFVYRDRMKATTSIAKSTHGRFIKNFRLNKNVQNLDNP